MNERAQTPDISFKPLNLLRVQGAILETDDFTPVELRQFVIDTHSIITDKIENIYANALKKARRPEFKQRSSILIARLALGGSVHEHIALTQLGRRDLSSVHTDPAHFTERTLEYVEQLHHTPFTPEVRVRLYDPNVAMTPETTGVWLSLAPKPIKP